MNIQNLACIRRRGRQRVNRLRRNERAERTDEARDFLVHEQPPDVAGIDRMRPLRTLASSDVSGPIHEPAREFRTFGQAAATAPTIIMTVKQSYRNF